MKIQEAMNKNTGGMGTKAGRAVLGMKGKKDEDSDGWI